MFRPGEGGFTFVEGEGARITDDEDVTYLDFVSQLINANAGYGNDAIAEAMTEQLQRLPYVAPKHETTIRSELS